MRTPYLNVDCKEVCDLPLAEGNEKSLMICAEDIRLLLLGNIQWHNLVQIVCCSTCDGSLEIITLAKKESFPILRWLYCVPAKFEIYGHTANVYYKNAHVTYFLQRNRNKVRSALLLYFCIRKRYQLIDKNVVRRIARLYTEHVSDIPCEDEDEIRKQWRKAKIEKLEKKYRQENTRYTKDIQILVKRDIEIKQERSRIREKRVRLKDGFRSNLEYLDQIEKMKNF